MNRNGIVQGFRDGKIVLDICKEHVRGFIPPEESIDLWEIRIDCDPCMGDADQAYILRMSYGYYILELVNTKSGDVDCHECVLTEDSVHLIESLLCAECKRIGFVS